MMEAASGIPVARVPFVGVGLFGGVVLFVRVVLLVGVELLAGEELLRQATDNVTPASPPANNLPRTHQAW